MDRTPPHDVGAEQAVLGACIQSAKIAAHVLEAIRPADLYVPRHEVILTAVSVMLEAGDPIEPQTVNSWLLTHGELPKVGHAYLAELVGLATIAVEHDLGIIKDLSVRREGLAATIRIQQDLYESADQSDAIIHRAELAFGSIGASGGDVDSLMTLDEFVDQPMPEEDWIIPDLLARGDRLVLTGEEGLGKTTLIRQLAVCAAAGVDPFTGRAVPPMTVLAIDVENPQRIMIDRYGALRAAVRRHGYSVDGKRLWLDRRQGGINLADAKDRRWLSKRVALVNPDLLVIGPAYKLYFAAGNTREEDLARLVTDALDQIREQVNCAIVLEHHSPHAAPGAKTRDVRPIGSSLWLRWPEFGFGISKSRHPDAHQRRLVDFTPWRGPRDVRRWPEQLESGGSGLPWVETIG